MASKVVNVLWQRKADRRLKRILAILSGRQRQATVSVVGLAAMTRLNFRYRKKRRPTDVLSFPAPEVFARQGVLGELIICLPILRRQARELGNSLETELDILLVHGFTHLLGYDHERGEAESIRQRRRERALLARLWGRRSAVGLIERSK